MKFNKLSENIIGEYDNIVRDKLEYFWDFWDFLFTENRNLILVNEPKFISQVSLLSKLENHLEWNKKISSKRLLKYLNGHEYFEKSNIILRSSKELERRISKLKRDIESFDSSNFQMREDLLQSVKSIRNEHFDIEVYSEFVIERLLKIIFSGVALSKNCRKDLKFLCNTIIDILIIKGYSLQLVKNLLNYIIFSTGNKYNFIYKKKYTDFENNSDFDEYVEMEFSRLTLKDRLNHIEHYLVVQKNKGNYIFKIDGVQFESTPVEIFGVKFYNPKQDRSLSYYKVNDQIDNELEKYCSSAELFLPESNCVIDDDIKESHCNAIVPVEYLNEDVDYFDVFKFPAKSYIEAKSKVQISFLELRRYIRSYSTEYFNNESIYNSRISEKCILTDENLNIHKKSNTHDLQNVIFKLDGIRDEMIKENLKYKERIKSQSDFFFHVANSNALIAKYNLENHKFNFKSLWIECLEPYFSSNEEFTEYAKYSVKIRTNIFHKYRILLSNSLGKSFSTWSSYHLGDEELDRIGIGILKIGERISSEKLQKNFELLPQGSLLDEFKLEMKSIMEEEHIVEANIDRWIENITNFSYDERNIEVHYNVVDYYSNISLKKDILFISSCLIGAINDAIYLENVNCVDGVKDYIECKFKELNRS